MDRIIYIGMNRTRARQLHRDLGEALTEHESDPPPFEVLFPASMGNEEISVSISNDDMENRDDVTDNTVFVQID